LPDIATFITAAGFGATDTYPMEGEVDLPGGWIKLDQYGERATDGNRIRLRFAVSPLMFEESF
jgi:hypothetical protein